MFRIAVQSIIFAEVADSARLKNRQNELELNELEQYIMDLGESEDKARKVASIIDQSWPAGVEEDNRRMKASQFLHLEARMSSLNSRKQKQSSNSTHDSTAVCKPLAALSCRGAVEWAHREGKYQDWAGESYYDMPLFTGMSITSASQQDFQKLFFCDEDLSKDKCSNPPCSCSKPPCNSCDEASGDGFHYDPAVKTECHAHPYCVGSQGDCCPNPNGTRAECCDYNPPREAVGPAIEDFRPDVPGEQIEKTLQGGRFLGSLDSTKCASDTPPHSTSTGRSLADCALDCHEFGQCRAISFFNGNCKLFTACNPIYSSDASMVFVKNWEGMTAHWLPNRTVSSSDGSHHVFVIGDWGSESCPNKDSMHYVYKGIQPGTERWEADHNAQKNVANQMGKIGEKLKPFMVLNAGDNFYWGGVLPKIMGGNDIHDVTSWERAFEEVYTHPSLQIPWLGVMGNHDYGGDGCMANVRAQFDYTIKDMLKRNRWKMPSPFYNHVVSFGDYTAEFFNLDTNIEDAFTGRAGGICKQSICLNMGLGDKTVPFKECKDWFDTMWAEQKKWLPEVLAASTADWKIITMHHKPHGDIARLVHPLAQQYGVHMMIGSHTHELAFFESWENSKLPLLVVGAGGGAQSNPGCGRAAYCSQPGDYGFGDIQITEKQLTVQVLRHKGDVMITRNICKDGSVVQAECA